MRLNHLGLPVRDEQRSQQFYSAYFGFDLATAQEYEDGTVIIRNAEGFDLALHPTEHIEPSPAFLHAGFRVAAPDEVRPLLTRMKAAGIIVDICTPDEGCRYPQSLLAPGRHNSSYTSLSGPGPRELGCRPGHDQVIGCHSTPHPGCCDTQ